MGKKNKKWMESNKNHSRYFPQGQRVWDSKGVTPTLSGEGGGWGGKTGLYAIRQPLKFLQRNQKNIEGDYAFTVDGANTRGIKQGIKIRRLTPIECERLQGFLDGWTAGTKENPISDTQRYKQLGNAVSVPVVEAIAKRMFPI